MARNWFIKTKAGEHGPLSARQLKALADAGRVVARTMVRREDQSKWINAERIEGLFDELITGSEDPGAKPEPWRRVDDVAAEPQNSDNYDSDSDLVILELASATPPIASTGELDDSESSVLATKRDSPRAAKWMQFAKSFGNTPVIGAGVAAVVVFASIAVFFATREKETFKNDLKGQPSAPLSTEELVASSEAGVAFIKGRLATGTGFIIQNGVVATNRHVIDGELMRHIEVHFPSARESQRGPYEASILYLDDDIDFALLQVNVPLPPLRLAEQHLFRRGQEVIVIGNPGVTEDVILQNAISRGVMSTQAVIDGRQYNQLGISINSGNSGGPVLNESGAVIGIVTLKAAEKEGLGFSIPLSAITARLTKATAMPIDEVATIQSMHRARVVFTYVNASGLIYRLGMAAYTEAMENAIASGSTASEGLKVVRAKIESQQFPDSKKLPDKRRFWTGVS